MRKEPDHYQKKARQQGYRTRSAYKLIEMDDKLSFLTRSHSIIELGCAPGGWTQVIRERAPNARLVACDLQPIQPLKGVSFIQGDFRAHDVRQNILSLLGSVDLVLSDMSPNISGQKIRDQAAMAELIRGALMFAHNVIASGVFLTKIFQGEESESLIQDAKALFNQVRIIRSSVSRKKSKEQYLYMRSKDL